MPKHVNPSVDQVARRSTVGCDLTENVNPEVDMKMANVVPHVQTVAMPAVPRLVVVTQGTLGQVRNIFDRNVSERELHAQE